MLPRWTTVPAIAEYVGVHPDTVRDWIAGGVLPAARVQKRHYADARPRKTARGHWRIYEADVENLLTSLLLGPPGRRRRRVRALPASRWRR
jgi:excisionase family DNA binding protein